MLSLYIDATKDLVGKKIGSNLALDAVGDFLGTSKFIAHKKFWENLGFENYNRQYHNNSKHDNAFSEFKVGLANYRPKTIFSLHRANSHMNGEKFDSNKVYDIVDNMARAAKLPVLILSNNEEKGYYQVSETGEGKKAIVMSEIKKAPKYIL